MGRTKLTITGTRPLNLGGASTNATVKGGNLVSVPTAKAKKNKKTKDVVTRSFKTAYNKQLPTKEIRFDDVNLTMSTSGVFLASEVLSNISNNTQSNQRIGDKIYVAYLHIKGTIANNDTKYKTARVMVVKERTYESLGTGTPVPCTNIYKQAGTATHTPSGTQMDMRYPLNKELCSRIYDKVYKVPPETQGCVILDLKIPVRRYINYRRNQTGGTTTDGRLLFLLNLADIDNSPTVTTVIYTAMMRVFFKDAH